MYLGDPNRKRTPESPLMSPHFKPRLPPHDYTIRTIHNNTMQNALPRKWTVIGEEAELHVYEKEALATYPSHPVHRC